MDSARTRTPRPATDELGNQSHNDRRCSTRPMGDPHHDAQDRQQRTIRSVGPSIPGAKAESRRCRAARQCQTTQGSARGRNRRIARRSTHLPAAVLSRLQPHRAGLGIGQKSHSRSGTTGRRRPPPRCPSSSPPRATLASAPVVPTCRLRSSIQVISGVSELDERQNQARHLPVCES